MRWQNYIFVFFTLVLSLIVTNNLEAQTNIQIEEIVVTSTKKDTSLQDTHHYQYLLYKWKILKHWQ